VVGITGSFALCTFSRGARGPQAGLVIDERIWAVEELAAFDPSFPMAGASVLEMLQCWSEILPALDRLARLAPGALGSVAPADCKIHPPVDAPRQIFCAGANYRQHVIDITLDLGVGPQDLQGDELRRWAETMMDERARCGDPYVFTKPLGALAGGFDPIEVPDAEVDLDWELELAVIIGRSGYRIPRERAGHHVAGFAVANDISARQLIQRKDYPQLGTDWLQSKGQKGFLPLGPYLVPANFIDQPENLAMRLSVGDTLMQDARTDDMIFGIPRLIEYISTATPLFPGDVICTGSPAGNGTHYGRFLAPGDIMVAEIEGLGRQRTECMRQGQAPS
jgi:2-keto-4-pentenoate hydratase/2-oxohepta-3-ene-1,7-dioic acid hydratase in catechol pathway